MARVTLLTPPSPPYSNIDRQAAGGMGLWVPSSRPTVGHDEFTWYDLSLLWTAGVLVEAGHDVCFLDGQAERLDGKALAARLQETQPDVIVALVQFVSLESDLALLGDAKRSCSGVHLVIVGSVTRTLTERIVSAPEVDYVVVSEPEFAVRELVAALANGGNAKDTPGLAWHDGDGVLHSASRPATDLTALPVAPYHLLSPYRYIDRTYFRDDKVGLVAATRGCPYKCAYYCPYPLAYGKKIRCRPAKVIVKEIELLNSEFGVRSFYFRDQVFTISESHAREICEGITAAGLDIRWICETRFDLLKNDETLRAMSKAGCTHIFFGLESGDPALFEAIGKPGTTLTVVEDSVRRVIAHGIEVHCHLILGLPGETWRTVKNTGAFLEHLGTPHVNLNRCIPYPGTELYADAKRNKWIKTYDWTRYGSSFAMRTEAMSTYELELAHFWLSRQHRRRHGLPLRKRDRLLAPLVDMIVKLLGGKGSVPKETSPGGLALPVVPAKPEGDAH